MSSGWVMRVSKNFRDLITEMKILEEERGNISCSDLNATEILYMKIKKAGGIKND